MSAARLILASRSPRRHELLTEAGYKFDVIVPQHDVECGVCSERGPAGLVAELALRKATAVREIMQKQGQQSATILAADTVAECAGLVLGKPPDEEAARYMLRQLRGRDHRVLTGLCVWPLSRTEPRVEVAVTNLRMDNLSDAQIDAYIATGQWEGKAGGFGYQDQLGWVHVHSGSESNVVGLPLELLSEMLVQMEATPDEPGG
jgi:septum formation protein